MLHRKMLRCSIFEEVAMFMTIVGIVFLGSVLLAMYMELKG